MTFVICSPFHRYSLLLKTMQKQLMGKVHNFLKILNQNQPVFRTDSKKLLQHDKNDIKLFLKEHSGRKIFCLIFYSKNFERSED